MQQRRKLSAFTQIELIISISLMLLLLGLSVPASHKSQGSISSQAAAADLASRLRLARQTAQCKGIPVALAIPRSSQAGHSDTSFIVEGEDNPQVTSTWKIQQSSYSTVFYVGVWPGTSMTNPPTSPLNSWWKAQSSARLASAFYFRFEPTGELLSNAPISNNSYHIVVGQGIQSDPVLRAAENPWTISLSPSGEVSTASGLIPAAPLEGKGNLGPVGAVYIRPTQSQNQEPTAVGDPIALPDNTSPIAQRPADREIDVSDCLTLEMSVDDQDGDPPFITWSTTGVEKALAPILPDPKDKDLDGGRFSTPKAQRMEWDGTHWVGRTTWVPSPRDPGGWGYQLHCDVVDRRGGKAHGDFPINGGWLRTHKRQVVLFSAINQSNGRRELWTVNTDGQEPKRVAFIPNDDIKMGSWSPDGLEYLAVGNNSVWRYDAQGAGSKIADGPADSVVRSAALSQDKRTIYFLYMGGNKGRNLGVRAHDIESGAETDHQLADGKLCETDTGHCLTFARLFGRNLLLSTYRHKAPVGIRVEKHNGGLVIEIKPNHTAEMVPGGNQDTGLTNIGFYDQNSDGGLSFSQDGKHLLYCRDNVINVAKVNWDGVQPLDQLSPGQVENSITDTLHADVHDASLMLEESGTVAGAVYAYGRGAASGLASCKWGQSPRVIPIPAGLSDVQNPVLSPLR